MASPQINIDEILLQAQGADENQRSLGMNALNNLAQQNLSSFLIILGTILSNESKDPKIRILSAIVIKNSLLYSEDYRKKWKTEISKEEKDKIKLLILSTLASSQKNIRTMAGTVISSICKIDTPITETWPDLLPSLTNNAFNEDINMKLSAIETLGYVSDDENEDDDVENDDPEYEEEEVESSESEYEDEEEQSESEGEDEGDDALSEKGKEWEEMEEDAKKSDNERAKRMKENERFKKNKNNNVRNKKK